MQYNIPDVHPAAVISAFHQNVRNRKMREELAMTKVKDVASSTFWPIGAPGLKREGSTPAKTSVRKPTLR